MDATLVQAINRGLREEMERDDRVMLLGEDVGVDGGIFRVTDGLLSTFGPERVVDTPLAESAIVGASIGLAVGGMRPIPEIQFSGFAYYAFHQIESHLSRLRSRSRGRFPVPLVVRMPYGGGIHALEHHSESVETFFGHIPGLKVVAPRGPRKGLALLKAAIRDPDPVIFLEPAALYRRIKEPLPEEGSDEVAPLGEAEVVREGSDLTLVAYGAMVPPTLRAAEALAAEGGADPEVIDLQTLAPLDGDTITTSVRKTGRAVIVQEAPRTLGMAAEVMASINEDAFWHLEAPPARVTGYDVHVPLFAREEAYLPDEARILAVARETLEA